jgi:hypothetical protein
VVHEWWPNRGNTPLSKGAAMKKSPTVARPAVVAIEEVRSQDWAEEVYRPTILNKPEKYTM